MTLSQALAESKAVLAKPMPFRAGFQGSRSGEFSHKGMRQSLEDVCISLDDARGVFWQLAKACPHLAISFYAVIDGHGGKRAANYTQKHLGKNIAAILCTAHDAVSVKKALIDGFRRTDKGYLEVEATDEHRDGACLTVALWLGHELYIASLGDTQAVLARTPEGEEKPKSLALSQPHTPLLLKEKERIRKAGATIIDGRVNGKLAVSRAIGDASFKAYGVIPTPEVLALTLEPSKDHFLVLACDGLFGCYVSEAVVGLVSEALNRDLTPASVAKEVVLKAIHEKNCKDNCSILVVQLGSS